MFVRLSCRCLDCAGRPLLEAPWWASGRGGGGGRGGQGHCLLSHHPLQCEKGLYPSREPRCIILPKHLVERAISSAGREDMLVLGW